MKTGNKALVFLSVILLTGMIVSGFILSNESKKINLNDKLKNYTPIKAGTFRALKISGGNSFPVEIKQGNTPDIKVLKSRAGFLKTELVNDTLKLNFAVSNSTIGPGETQTGLIIQVPELDYISLEKTYNRIIGFSQDSLELVVKENTYVDISAISIGKFNLSVGKAANVSFSKNNQAKTLLLTLQKHSHCRMNEISFDQFYPVIGDSATISFSSKSINQVLKK